ncbi:hypothetical protein, partial [Escherichia coli]|uniref:hypothetical protein n=1 Tax=Escherichia coli TaxID=562 RepID=UPI0013872799
PGNIRELENIMKRVLMEVLENPGSSRSEIIAMEIEKRKKKAEKMIGIENEWHSKRIFKEVKEGELSFWDIRQAYLNHELNRYQLEEIIKEGL